MANPAGTDSAPKLDSGRAKYRVVKRLASPRRGHERDLATFGVEERRVVVERIDTSGLTLAERDALIARSKALAATVSPHLPRVVESSHDGTTLTFVSTWTAGEWLERMLEAELREGTSFVALAVGLRVVLDVLAALNALHSAKTAVVHGHVSPRHVLVGLDGHSRLSAALFLPGPPEAADAGYLAPEILLGDGTADVRADVYSASALLWEALSGRRLFSERTVEEVLARQLAGPVPRAEARESWAEPLVDVAARGLSVDPAARYSGVNEIAMAVRMVAQARLAAPTRVGRAVESLSETSASQRRSQRASALSAAPAAATNVLEQSGTVRVAPLPASAPAENEVQARPPSAPRLPAPAKPPPVPRPRDSERTLPAGTAPTPSSPALDIATPRVAFDVVRAAANEDKVAVTEVRAREPVGPALAEAAVAAVPPPVPSAPAPLVPPPPSSDAVLDVAAMLPPGVPPPPPTESELEIVDVEVYADPPAVADGDDVVDGREPTRRKRTALVLTLLGFALLILATGVVLAVGRRAHDESTAQRPIHPATTSAPAVVTTVVPTVATAATATPTVAETARAVPTATTTPTPTTAAAPGSGQTPSPEPTAASTAAETAAAPTPTAPGAPRKPRKPRSGVYEPEGI